MPRTRHRISGVEELDTPQHIIDHEHFGKYLELIEDDGTPVKNIVPELVSTKHAKEIAAASRQNKSEDKDK